MDADPRKDVIDLASYRKSRSESRRTGFTVWGGEGERSRLALPVWRAIYLAGGDRGGIVISGKDAPDLLVPFFVLDLADEVPRLAFDPSLVRPLQQRGDELEDGVFEETVPGGVVVFLGGEEGRRWFLVVEDGGSRTEPLEAASRADILFLAGECSGLLFRQGLAELPGGEPFSAQEEDAVDDADYLDE